MSKSRKRRSTRPVVQPQSVNPHLPGYVPPNLQNTPAYSSAVSAGTSGTRPAVPAKRKASARKKKKPDPSAKSAAYQTSKGYREKILMGQMDLPFFLIVMVLLTLGIVMMFSASYAIAINEGKSGTFYAQKQIGFGVLGVAAMLFFSRFRYQYLQTKLLSYGSYGISLVLLVIVLFTHAPTGYHRWIYIGSFNFQPSEIMKLALIIVLSYHISKHYHELGQFKKGLLPMMLLLAMAAGLIVVETHLSATIIICSIAVIMMFVGGINLKHLMMVGVVGLGGLIAGVFGLMAMDKFGFIQDRFNSWLDPFNAEYMKNSTWQTCQSLIAIGSGGIFGLGLGNSRQKYLYLPEAENDFVFSIVCEELGLIGAMMVILLFALFIFRGFYIASKAPDKFGMMLTVGITVQIGLQALLNIAVVTNSIPNTGVSLPFFSYGGTALIMQLAEVGIILNVSRQATIET